MDLYFMYYGNDFGISKLTRFTFQAGVYVHPLFKRDLCSDDGVICGLDVWVCTMGEM